MKKTAIFIVLFLVLAAPLFAQGNGFLNALHSNNIDTERRDSKSFESELIGRYQISERVYIIGYAGIKESVYNLIGGISFVPSDNVRFDVGGGGEFLEVPGQSERQKGPAFMLRGYVGDDSQTNTAYVNLISGTRVWWQAMYLHSIFEWAAIGVIAEDEKGGGIRTEIYPQKSPSSGIGIFSNVFYNGEDPAKKINADITVDVGIFFTF